MQDFTTLMKSFFAEIGPANPKSAELDIVVCLELTDVPGKAWSIDYRNKKRGAVQEGKDPAAVATIRMKSAVLNEILSNRQQARSITKMKSAAGDITVIGDMTAASRFRKVLSPTHG